MPHQLLHVSKEDAHLFEELNIIDVGIVNEDVPDLSGASSSHISSPGRLLHRSRRSSSTSSPPSISLSAHDVVNNESGIDDEEGEDVEDADEMSIATTVSSLSNDSLPGTRDGINDNDEILSLYPEVQFEFSDQQDFITEINDWFVMNDLTKLGKVKQIFLNSIQIDSFMGLHDDNQERIIRQLLDELKYYNQHCNFQGLLKTLICLNYILMGCFDEITDDNNQKINIFENLTKMIAHEELFVTIIDIIKLSMDQTLQFNPQCTLHNLLELSTLSFYATTILYFTLCFILDSESQFYLTFKSRDKLVATLNQSQIMIYSMKVIDSWRWLSSDPENMQSKAKQSLKIRNVIILISKLTLLEFGGTESLKSTKKFLKTFHIKDDVSEASTEFQVSPLDYHHYKEELKMRYPSFIPPNSSLSKLVETTLEDFSQSSFERGQVLVPILNRTVSESLINEPFSQRRAAAMNNSIQTPPDIHIATPAPSPTLSPVSFDPPRQSPIQDKFFEFKDNKKIFQNTSSYPYLYPADDDAPHSIKEATQIFFNSVKEDLNTKQFMSVFEEFIIQERGVLNTIKDSDKQKEFEYDEEDIKQYPQFKDEIVSLMRVETFYKESLSYFNSLVKVLLQTIESSSITKDQLKKFNQSQEKELTREETSKLVFESDQSGLSTSLKQKFEIARVKEITLKHSSMILHFLLKWFKLSHLLKFEFLSMIIFDNNYYQTCLDFIATNYEENLIHLNNHNDFMLENLNIDDQDLISKKFNNDELAALKYQYYSEFNYNKILKEEFHIPEYNFFNKCLTLSSHPDKSIDDEQLRSDAIDLFKEQDNLLKDQLQKKQMLIYYGINNPKLIVYNWKYCFILTNLLNVLYYTMNNNKTQRVNQLIDKKPTDLLKFCLRLHNKFYYRPILKIIKLMIPFNGRKWKSNNMDSISMIYLYYKVGLKDDWLTKNYNNANLDIGEELKRSYKQEYSLRSLLQYYNIKHYEKEMTHLGYEYYETDFFNKELEVLSRLYLSSQGNTSNE